MTLVDLDAIDYEDMDACQNISAGYMFEHDAACTRDSNHEFKQEQGKFKIVTTKDMLPPLSVVTTLKSSKSSKKNSSRSSRGKSSLILPTIREDDKHDSIADDGDDDDDEDECLQASSENLSSSTPTTYNGEDSCGEDSFENSSSDSIGNWKMLPETQLDPEIDYETCLQVVMNYRTSCKELQSISSSNALDPVSLSDVPEHHTGSRSPSYPSLRWSNKTFGNDQLDNSERGVSRIMIDEEDTFTFRDVGFVINSNTSAISRSIVNSTGDKSPKYCIGSVRRWLIVFLMIGMVGALVYVTSEYVKNQEELDLLPDAKGLSPEMQEPNPSSTMFNPMYIKTGNMLDLVYLDPQSNQTWISDEEFIPVSTLNDSHIIVYTNCMNSHGDVGNPGREDIYIDPEAMDSLNISKYGYDAWSKNLYCSERYSEKQLFFNIPVLQNPETTYQIKLHFNEIYFRQIKSREITIIVEGQKIVNNLDIYKEAGEQRYTAIVVEIIQSNITDGILHIELDAFTNHPKINAIEVASIPKTSSTQTGFVGITVVPAPAYVFEKQVSISSIFTTISSDNNITSNVPKFNTSIFGSP